MTDKTVSVPQPYPEHDCPACERGEKSIIPPPTSVFPKPMAVHMPSGNICQKFINPELLETMRKFHAKRKA
jgi:hypothetical protein